MIIDQFNLNQLRVFISVYDTKNMTDAAHKIHLTQSGISQHIKSLEDTLGRPLFDRIKNKLIPTPHAHELYKKCIEAFYLIEGALTHIKGAEDSLTGKLSIGMPIEFGNNIILPLLAEFSHSFPLIQFEIRMGFATEMNEGILNGHLDFAFIDDFTLDKRISTLKIYDEILCLCAHRLYLEPKGPLKKDKEYFEKLDYLDYQIGEPVLRYWFLQNLGYKSMDLHSRVHVMDVQAIARMILHQMGVGVLPEHLVHKMQGENPDLIVFKGSGKTVKNAISMAFLAQKTWHPAAEKLRTFLIDKLKK